MISRFVPLARSFAFRNAPPALRRPAAILRPACLSVVTRTAASSVSGRPASQTIEHAATNIKEEMGNSAADLAKMIAGANMNQDAVKPTEQTFVRQLAIPIEAGS